MNKLSAATCLGDKMPYICETMPKNAGRKFRLTVPFSNNLLHVVHDDVTQAITDHILYPLSYNQPHIRSLEL